MFRAIRDGVKNFDVRKDDRAFQAGDTVEFKFHDPDMPGDFFQPPAPWGSGPSKPDDLTPIKRSVTFVLRGGQYGVEPGYVVLALSDVTP
ncbi:hypothetical protein D3C87_1744730 [compost metagenome]